MCRLVFERGDLNSRKKNPAYSPPSAHHPVSNTKSEFITASDDYPSLMSAPVVKLLDSRLSFGIGVCSGF